MRLYPNILFNITTVIFIDAIVNRASTPSTDPNSSWTEKQTSAKSVGTDKIHMKVREEAKIRNRYNQGPQMTQDTTWKVTKTQLNITYKRAKRSALSQHVTTRLHEQTRKHDNHGR